MVFAGGCEELDWTLSVLFDAMGAMSSNYNDRPAVASRAYDVNRDGFVISGGAGIRSGRIRAGESARRERFMPNWSDTGRVRRRRHGRAIRRRRCERCMRMALQNVKTPIDYINPHATSTPVGDVKEIEAICASVRRPATSARPFRRPSR